MVYIGARKKRKILPYLKNIKDPESIKQIKKYTTGFVNRFRFNYKPWIIFHIFLFDALINFKILL